MRSSGDGETSAAPPGLDAGRRHPSGRRRAARRGVGGRQRRSRRQGGAQRDPGRAEVGRQSEADVRSIVADLAEAFESTEVRIDAEDTQYTTTASELGVAMDQDATVAAVLDVGDDTALPLRPFTWAAVVRDRRGRCSPSSRWTTRRSKRRCSGSRATAGSRRPNRRWSRVRRASKPSSGVPGEGIDAAALADAVVARGRRRRRSDLGRGHGRFDPAPLLGRRGPGTGRRGEPHHRQPAGGPHRRGGGDDPAADDVGVDAGGRRARRARARARPRRRWRPRSQTLFPTVAEAGRRVVHRRARACPY